MSETEDRRWSREYDRCRGYGDEAHPHPCGSPILPHAGNGRCSRCYQLHRKYLGQHRDIFPSINDVAMNGEGSVAHFEEATVVTTPSKAIDPALERSFAQLNGRSRRATPVPSMPAPAAPPPERAVPESDDYGFEVYTAPPAPRVVRPMISLRRDSGLYLNGAAYAVLGSPAYVELLYSRTKRVLALRPVEAESAHARPVKTLTDRTPRYRVALGTMLTHYGLTDPLCKGYEVKAFGGVQGIQLECAPEDGK